MSWVLITSKSSAAWFRVQGSGFGGWGLGFRVKSLGLRVQGSGLRVYERLVRLRLVLGEPQRHRASRGLGLLGGGWDYLGCRVRDLGLRKRRRATIELREASGSLRVWNMGFRVRG